MRRIALLSLLCILLGLSIPSLAFAWQKEENPYFSIEFEQRKDSLHNCINATLRLQFRNPTTSVMFQGIIIIAPDLQNTTRESFQLPKGENKTFTFSWLYSVSTSPLELLDTPTYNIYLSLSLLDEQTIPITTYLDYSQANKILTVSVDQLDVVNRWWFVFLPMSFVPIGIWAFVTRPRKLKELEVEVEE